MEEGAPVQKKSLFRLLPGAFFVFLKSTKIIAVLKLLKFGKPLVTVASLAISAILYGFWLGPWFSIGLLAMLFIHEMGHVIALRMKGMETSGPIFIPFLGAAIFVPKFGNRDTEAFVGFGGPLLGTFAALACFAVWPFTKGRTAEILLLVSYLGIFLNLFNLIPISPLDGGRVTQAVGSWFKYVGLGVLLIYTIVAQQPVLLIIWIIVLDSFDRMTLWLRPLISGVLGIAMAIFMVLGFSNQPGWANLIDIFVAIFLTWIYWDKDKTRSQKSTEETVDDREYPAMRTRMKWLGYYIALTVFTTIIILAQARYLPHAVKTDVEQLTSPPTLVQ